VERTVAEAAAAFGGIDIVPNNASALRADILAGNGPAAARTTQQ